MPSEFLLWSNIIIIPLAGCILLARRSNTVATFFFIAALSFITGLSYVDLQSLQHPEQVFIWRKYGLVLEAAVILSCYFYTKTAFRDNLEIYKGPGFWVTCAAAIALLVYVVASPIETLIYSPDFAEEHILFLTTPGFTVYLMFLGFLVFGLVQLERTLVGLHQLQRWGIKLEVVGTGLLLAAFAFYFSQNLLYRSINLDFIGLRSGAILIALALVCYSRIFRGNKASLSLSRGIAHRSFVLLIVGGYLVLLGIVGEGLRYFNVADVQLVFIALMLIGSLGLAGIFLSETLRRKFTVFLHKNFYQSKYDYREQWGKFAQCVTGGTTLVEIQTSILDLFCETLACKGASLYLHDPGLGRYRLSATFNFRRDWRPFSADDPLIVSLQKKDWIINLNETNPDLDGSLVESFSDINAFLVIPLFFDEELEGFIILGEQINSDEKLTYEDFDLLRMFARQSIAIVHGMSLTEQLSTTRELAAIGRVSTFVLHDLKNQVSGLSLMLDNAREYIEDPEFQQDMVETVHNTVDNMHSLIIRLKDLKEKPKLNLTLIDLQKVVADAVESAGGDIFMEGENVRIEADEEEIYKVVLNLLLNAREASADNNLIKVSFGQEQEQAFVRVVDKGCGMNADFVQHHLFKPFETTKKHGFGIGLYQCLQIVEACGGRIDVRSELGEGSCFTLHLPCG